MYERLQDFWYGTMPIAVQDATTIAGIVLYGTFICAGAIVIAKYVGEALRWIL